MIVSKPDSEGRAIVNHCESCSGHHEVMLKTVNEKARKEGYACWFECPHNAEGGPIMLKAIPGREEKVGEKEDAGAC